MSVRLARHLAFAFIAFVLLSASDCGGLTFSDIVTGYSTQITAKNNGPEPVIVVLYADDASNVGTVVSHGAPTITTHIQGAYNVIVLPAAGDSPSSLTSSLNSLRIATDDLYFTKHGGPATDLATASQRIADAKANLAAIMHPELALASCSAQVHFPKFDASPKPKPVELEATITKNADGSWLATCPGT